jgi:DNA-binding MarR family transcriptional regulator
VQEEEDRPGFALPLLLLAGFRALVDDLHAELARQGHPDLRPAHGFALQAVGPGVTSAAELGRALGVSKQAAAKTVDVLVDLGYLERDRDAGDRRRRSVRLTAHGRDALARAAATFDRLRAAWVAEVGADRVAAMEDDLAHLTAGRGQPRLDTPAWLASGGGPTARRAR